MHRQDIAGGKRASQHLPSQHPAEGHPTSTFSSPTLANLLDAFELDEETAEPLPEYGDFWPERTH